VSTSSIDPGIRTVAPVLSETVPVLLTLTAVVQRAETGDRQNNKDELPTESQKILRALKTILNLSTLEIGEKAALNIKASHGTPSIGKSLAHMLYTQSLYSSALYSSA